MVKWKKEKKKYLLEKVKVKVEKSYLLNVGQNRWGLGFTGY